MKKQKPKPVATPAMYAAGEAALNADTGQRSHPSSKSDPAGHVKRIIDAALKAAP